MSFKRYYNRLKNTQPDLKFSIGHICSNGHKTIVANVHKDNLFTLA